MTAPDPGLSDLIAAHVLSGPYIEYDSDGHHADDFYRCGKGCKWTSNDDMANRSAFAAHAAHVALVVELHTNGRIAELREWQIRVATALGMCEEVMGVGYSIANAKDASERAGSLTTLELEHVECPVWCDECERVERWQSCTHCNGSGCGPGTASGAYEECEWCAGDGRDHEPDLTARAEKAEATIASVREIRCGVCGSPLSEGSGNCASDAGRPHVYDEADLRAALEGEADADPT